MIFASLDCMQMHVTVVNRFNSDPSKRLVGSIGEKIDDEWMDGWQESGDKENLIAAVLLMLRWTARL